ncbi:MAG TPA: hypothetical protein VFM06_03860 [Candidatus Limnocylindria bacterium]|nr:hypothetical protein [Candidatus Limnocylindria bacterium]
MTVAVLAVAVLRPAVIAEVERPLPGAQVAAPLAQAPTAAGPAAATRPTAASFLLTMSDADLTAAAATSFPQTVSGVTVSDPDVRIASGGVRLTARAKVLFGTTQFVLQATPSASDGRLAVRVDSATLAGMSLPDSTRASISETLHASIARLVPADARITSVTLAAGSLSVAGTRP